MSETKTCPKCEAGPYIQTYCSDCGARFCNDCGHVFVEGMKKKSEPKMRFKDKKLTMFLTWVLVVGVIIATIAIIGPLIWPIFQYRGISIALFSEIYWMIAFVSAIVLASISTPIMVLITTEGE